MQLQATATLLDGTLIGADTLYTGVSTDSRSVTSGELFVALRGPNFDGHAFVANAAEKGAVAALVSEPPSISLPMIRVTDTYQALGHLAAHWRSRFDIPIIAVTGSNGKTTVKQMIGSILSSRETGLVAEGNLNNHIGVPLMLLRLRHGDRFAVLEFGMNHPGEVGYLTATARPTVALINNAGPAHLAGVGSIEGVARAKAEIFEGLTDGGVAVINTDDPHADLWRQAARGHRTIGFGLESDADVSSDFKATRHGSRLTLNTPAGRAQLTLALPGRHNVLNALAAAAASLAAGANLEQIIKGLEGARAVAGRLQTRRGLRGAALLDDTYNANPESLRAALDVLARLPGKRIVVLGDMGELGDEGEALHHQAGVAVRDAGADALLTVGELSRHATQAFGAGAEHHGTHDELIEQLRSLLDANTTILVKGSRAANMERVTNALSDDKNDRGSALRC